MPERDEKPEGTEDKSPKKRTKRNKSKSEVAEIKYYDIDAYFANRPELDPNMKFAFKVFMKGKSRQHSLEAFDHEFRNFQNREVR